MIRLRPSQLVSMLVLAGACERNKPPATADTLAAAQQSAADSARAAAPARNWEKSAGPLLLVEGDSPLHALLIFPDSAAVSATLAELPHPASVTLFGRNGTVQIGEIPVVADSDVCAVANLSATPPPRAWNVGFVGGVVAPIALDSMASLGRADSLDALTNITRLASAMPNDSAGRFTGLPFVVRTIWRFSVPGGPPTFIALVRRQINQEATPLQELTLIVAQRSSTDSTFSNVYSERSYGDEETIESRDILAAVQFGSGRTVGLVVARDYGNATAYGLVERDDDGKWRARWLSARRHC
ncbi:MAG: hypothetical protein ABI442_02155 [Gemmatimonadaceae bacterium]